METRYRDKPDLFITVPPIWRPSTLQLKIVRKVLLSETFYI